jgi:hypothetical protein
MSQYNGRQMHIVAQLPSGQGIEQGGWRWPGADKAAFINEDVYIKGVALKLDVEKGLFADDKLIQPIKYNEI